MSDAVDDQANDSGDSAENDREPVLAPAVRLRRTWPQRFTIVSGMALVVLSLASAWGLAEAYNSVGEIARIEVAPGLLEDELGSATEPRNILLVGSTSLEGMDENDSFAGTREDEKLADTIMLLRIEPVTAQATVMSINRDTYVPNIAGYSGKINGAYSTGGLELLLEVVKEMLDVPIDDFAVVHFAGFRELIDELDGVPVYFPYPSYDREAFFEIDAGCHVLDGQTALNYVRARHYVQVIDGKPEKDPFSDYTRTERQRDFLILTMERAIDRGVRNPAELRRLVRAVTNGGAVTLDDRLTIDDIARIGNAFGNFDPETLRRWQLPVEPVPGSGSNLRMIESDAEPVLNYFRGLGYTITNANVRVKVVDGRARGERGGDTVRPDRDLTERGFVSIGYSNAAEDELTQRTTITYSSDNEGKALLLARNLSTRPRFVAVTGLNKLILTVGSDWAGTLDEPLSEDAFAGSLPTTTTTTVAPGSSTTEPSQVTTTTIVVDDDTSGGIIGKPPEGVTCE